MVEKSEADVDEVRERFGDRIARTVDALYRGSEEIADFEQRKAALRGQVAAGGPDAHMVYAADKVAKARELRAQACLLGLRPR